MAAEHQTITIDKRIQLSHELIRDMIREISSRSCPRVLIFGLGYDTPLWQRAVEDASGQVVFVEENDTYISMNPSANVLKVTVEEWGTKVGNGSLQPDTHLLGIHPELVGKEFDVILVDAPTGFSSQRPGRQGACIWASLLASSGAAIYVDDTERLIEARSIKRYFVKPDFTVVWNKHHKRKQCTKIIRTSRTGVADAE